MKNKLPLIGFLVLSSLMLMGAVATQITTFSDGNVLTAAQLNNEYGNLYSTINNLDNANVAAGANILPEKIDASIGGNGLARDGSTGVLSVNVDGSTVEINADAVRVKDAGITSAKILDGTIAAGDLASNSVTTVKITDLNVTTGKLNDLAVTTAKIDATAVTAAKLATDAVTTTKIADANVTTAKITDANVTSAKMESSINLPGSAVKGGGAEVVVANNNEGANLSMLRGAFNGTTGALLIGSGYTIAVVGVGTYNIFFNTAFSDSPAVTCAAYAATANPNFCVVYGVSSGAISVKIYNYLGTPTNSDVMFHVIGRRI